MHKLPRFEAQGRREPRMGGMKSEPTMVLSTGVVVSRPVLGECNAVL
jgi:hypothetical protein